MNIVVCQKQILDPLMPAREFRVDENAKMAVQGDASLVTNIFCENALESALQFREKLAGTKITALTLGTESAEDSLRKALAMKADNAVLVVNEGNVKLDPMAVAEVLAAAIKKIGQADLVLVGRESGDWGAGQTGGLLAEILGYPCVNFVDQIENLDGKLQLKRQTDDGYEILEATLPLVVTITNDEHNVPRIPKTRDVMMSFRQPLTKFTLADLNLNLDAEGYYEVVELGIPLKDVQCELVAGDSLEQKVERFAQRILAITQTL